MKKGCLIAVACVSGLFLTFLLGGIILALLAPTESNPVAASGETEKVKNEAKESAAGSLPSEEVKAPPEASGGQEIATSEPIAPPVFESAPSAVEAQDKANEDDDFANEAKALYLELKAMRNKSEFHEFGFGRGGSYRNWFESFKDLQERTRGNTDLMIKGIMVGDLYTIGQAWMRNEGGDTETSLTLARSLDEAFGIASIYLPRTWTSADGQRTFEGELMEISEGNVTILKEEESITFPISKLSREDQIALGQNVSFETKDGHSFRLVSVIKATGNSVVVSDGEDEKTVFLWKLPEAMASCFSKPRAVIVQPTPPKKTDIGDVHGAWAFMQQFVQRELKNPRSAKFPFGGSRQVQDLGGGRYQVDSWVESTNSFGATIRTDFTGTIERVDDGWKLETLAFD